MKEQFKVTVLDKKTGDKVHYHVGAAAITIYTEYKSGRWPSSYEGQSIYTIKMDNPRKSKSRKKL